MSLNLPERASYEYLKKLAKERLAVLRTRNRAAKLADAHLAIAREYGFSSWRALKAELDLRRAPNVAAFIQACAAGDVETLRELLKRDPGLARERLALSPEPWSDDEPRRVQFVSEALHDVVSVCRITGRVGELLTQLLNAVQVCHQLWIVDVRKLMDEVVDPEGANRIGDFARSEFEQFAQSQRDLHSARFEQAIRAHIKTTRVRARRNEVNFADGVTPLLNVLNREQSVGKRA